MRRLLRRPAAWVAAAVAVHLAAVGAATLSAAPQAAPPSTPQPFNALPAERTGAEIYRAACATCHGPDGRGTARPAVGFERVPRDFTDCTATAEPTPDWEAVVHEGGPIRALDRHMPAFGDALTPGDIRQVVGYLRTFCADLPKWPSGDLNFPRAFYTEKAFPENETVLTTEVATGQDSAVGNTLVYERRIGSRGQVEAVIPIDAQEHTGEGPNGPWVAGIGDVALALRHTFFHSSRSGTIAAAGGEVTFPTGNEYTGLGSGYFIYEPFAMWGQALPRNSYLQVHGGLEIPSDGEAAVKEAYLRTAIGTTFAQDRGFGRAWSPQVELLWAHPFGEPSAYDLVPQIQVSLSKLQHVLVSGGVRLPVTQRDERKPQVVLYVLWDWFDGGLLSFWK